MLIGINGNEANIQNRVGVNQYAASLLTALEKLPAAKKHDFIVYLSSDPGDHLPKAREGWNYKILPGGGLWIVSTLMPFLLVTRKKPDVLFTPSHYSPPISSIPTVVSVMDLGYLNARDQFRLKDFIQLKYWTAWSIRRAIKIIAISESTKKEIIVHYPMAKDKTVVTHLGYDKAKFKSDPLREASQIGFKIQKSKVQIDQVKKKYGIEGDYVLYLGTLKPNKNVEGIVKAFAQLQSLPLTLVIAGKKGWLYEQIFKLVEENNIKDRVVFTDFVKEEDKPALIAGASVFVSPSFWEGFGIHILEAMAMGTPVVCSREGSLPEVGGKAVVYVNPHDPASIAWGIREALKNHDVLKNNGLTQARKFSWEKTAAQTLQILESATL
ncbi:MAG: Group 1 glycosyl transferase [Microgenomates group bacterium Gr01-1014_5]|nr:MAG: Group 1 glycosyl transferase [Microgenomates group bacterium Gr01-1014_5]